MGVFPVNRHVMLSCACILILISVMTVPVLAATVTCPSSCSCLLPAEAKKAGYSSYCSGKQQVCAVDSQQNEKYCYAKTTNATVVPQLIVTGYQVLTTAPAPAAVPAACPAGCSCFTPDDGKRQGLGLCGGTKTLCGYTADQQPEYCHEVPVTAVSPGGSALAAITVTATRPLIAQAVPRVTATQEIAPVTRVAAAERCTISGRIHGFWHNTSSLRVRFTRDGGEPMDVYVMAEPGPIDAVSPVHTFLGIVPCNSATDIEPVYVANPAACPWTGTFTPSRITGIRVNSTGVSNQDFTFSRTDTVMPSVEISFSPAEPAAGEAASVTVRGRDDTGITSLSGTAEWRYNDGSVRIIDMSPLVPEPEGAPGRGELPAWSDTLPYGAPWYANLDWVIIRARACDASGNEGRGSRTLIAGSCTDDYKNRDEEQVDCGGTRCAPCIPCTWCSASVHPLLIRGDYSDKIDVIFVPEEDYDRDTARFITDTQNVISLGYYRNDAIGMNRTKFNFYYMTAEAEVTPADTATFTPPGSCTDFYDDTSFAESVAIIHNEGFRDWSGTRCEKRIFSAEPTSYRTFVHESGHSILGLKDEYCCDSHYRQNDPNPNIWGTQGNCTTDASGMSWSTSDCDEFCTAGSGNCGTGFWDNDPPWDIMACSQDCDPDMVRHCSGGMCQFEHACDRRVNYVFSQYP